MIDSGGVRQITLGGVVTTKLAFASSQAATCRPSPIRTCAIAEAFFLSPVGLAIDKNGYFYLGDTWGAIVRVSPSGVVEALAGLSDSGSPASSSPISGYTYPWAIGVNSSGELYFMIRGGLFKLR